MSGLVVLVGGVLLMGLVLWLLAPDPVEMTAAEWRRHAICGTCASPSCEGCMVAIRADMRTGLGRPSTSPVSSLLPGGRATQGTPPAPPVRP